MRAGRKPWWQTGIRDLLGAVRRGGGDVTLTRSDSRQKTTPRTWEKGRQGALNS